MISNLYFWIFPAAVFTAAALSNLSFVIRKKNKQRFSLSNRIVWLFLNLSFALIVISGSVFFVNWSGLNWSWSYVYFFLIFVIVFYFGFVFKLVVGSLVFFFLSFIILFFTLYFYNWNIVPSSGEVARFRLLSTADNEIKAELYGIKIDPLFIDKQGEYIRFEFNTIKTNSFLFFIDPVLYYKWSEVPFNPGFFDKIVNYLADKTFFLSRETYSVSIGNETILYLYRIILSPENKIIIIDN